ncbi:hypothetical protein [Atlantibacter hermannii]|uniref:hypothetical protein n=1 Tax=Atlantibacter hermannii TaxID=565 RepID=UPI0028022D11|nr:hypothetical protein [Atlantibacter hermannii]MDQ7883673.1 hypothetical protein [Atlantibacter hermannii]
MTDNNKHLVRVGHEFAAAMSDDTPIITIAKMVTELASALDVQSARSEALAAALKASEANDADARCHVAELEAKCAALAGENAALIGFDADEFSYNGPYQPDDAVLEKLKTPATDAWVNEQRAHDLNVFIQHHSEKLDAHIRNGGEQFDSKSNELRNLIVSARLFREQLRGGRV